MATPSYLGAAQPTTGDGDGWLARLGSYLRSSGSPVYVGDGQPSQRASEVHFVGPFDAVTPTYRSAPAPAPCESTPSTEAATPASAASSEGPVTVTCPIDSAALAAGKIAIVVPRAGT